MNHDSTVDRRTSRVGVDNADGTVRLLIHLSTEFELFMALPEDRVFHQVDVGLLASRRIPFNPVCVSKAVWVSAWALGKLGLLDDFLGVVDADSPGLCFVLLGVGHVCGPTTDGLLGFISVLS